MQGTEEYPEIRISVTPEPDAAVIAVIAAAVRYRLHIQVTDREVPDHDEAQRPSQWAMAGRREAMIGRGNESGRDV